MSLDIRESSPSCTPQRRNHDAVSTTLKDGKLVVQGTNGADQISVKTVGDQIQVMNAGQVVATYPSSAVTDVKVRAHGGKDNLDVDVGPDKKVVARGGRGGDTINVENTPDAFVGAIRGHDTVNLTGSPNARVRGGRGTDVVNSADPFRLRGRQDRPVDACNAPATDADLAPPFLSDQNCTSSWSGNSCLPPARV